MLSRVQERRRQRPPRAPLAGTDWKVGTGWGGGGGPWGWRADVPDSLVLLRPHRHFGLFIRPD